MTVGNWFGAFGVSRRTAESFGMETKRIRNVLSFRHSFRLQFVQIPQFNEWIEWNHITKSAPKLLAHRMQMVNYYLLESRSNRLFHRWRFGFHRGIVVAAVDFRYSTCSKRSHIFILEAKFLFDLLTEKDNNDYRGTSQKLHKPISSVHLFVALQQSMGDHVITKANNRILLIERGLGKKKRNSATLNRLIYDHGVHLGVLVRRECMLWRTDSAPIETSRLTVSCR